MALFTRINPDVLTERLDAEFYKPVFLVNEGKLKKVGSYDPLSIILETLQLGYTGPTEQFYAENGINYLSSKNLINGFIEITDATDRISTSAHKTVLSKSAVKVNDVLIARTGNVGKSAVVTDDLGEANIAAHIIALRLDTKTDSYYLSSFLNSTHGMLQSERHQRGTIIQGLSVYDIPNFIIPRISLLAQKYIGDKVRLAERLRAWAKELRAGVDSILNELNLPTAKAPAIINRVSVELLDTRLDPRPYRTQYIGLVDQMKMIKNSLITDVSELASGCPVSSDDFIETGEVPLIRIRNIGFDEFIDIDTGVDKSVYAEETKYHAKEDMIVLGMDGIFRAQFFLADELPMLVNQRVAMLSTTDIRAELLTHWLNRAEGQMQLNQWAVKTTVEHTSLSDIGRVRIPRLERDVEDQLADKLLNARLAYRYSRFLTTAAKVLVEALIQGQIEEKLLIQAQDGLQTGNDSLDRSILNRLKTDGVDGKCQPLFADLDQLYSLLEQASEQ